MIRYHLLLCYSEHNVRTLKNKYKFIWFVVTKIRNPKERKSRDRTRCTVCF
jgi:hypothetical protein